MDRPLRILMLEDVAADAELAERALREAKMIFSAERVDTESGFRNALSEFNPDIILADYSLPSFDGMSALAIASEVRPDIPFVFVSGAIGEERAIEALKNGATDYVLKDRMSRLVPSVRQALRGCEERIARENAEEALRASEQRHRVLLQVNNAVVVNLDRTSLLSAIAGALAEIIPLERVSLVLHDEGKDVLRVHAVAGSQSPNAVLAIETEFPRRGSPLEHLFETQQPLVRDDLTKNTNSVMEENLRQAGIRSYVAVPLLSQTRVFGSLNIASRSRRSYSELELGLLLEVGQQVSLAVKNMLAYEEIGQLKSELEQQNVYLQEEIKTAHNFEEIIGDSPAIKKSLADVETVAGTDANVLITGETGTGKELLARAVHNLSPRKNKALIKVNCASIPKELFESEFFGHVRGAFTGAIKERLGRFQLADGGTLFLDEVCEIPIELQSKLLRVLQEGEYERIGEEKTRSVDVRIIAATNRDIEKEIPAGRFRSDLYFRLSVFPIDCPTLSARLEDIPLLTRHFVAQACRRFGVVEITIPQSQIRRLQSYHWPGNIRELQNVIERAVITSRSGTVHCELPSKDAEGVSEKPSSSLTMPPSATGVLSYAELKQREYENVLGALNQTDWKVAGPSGAAQLLGVKPSTLASRMKGLGIQRRG